MIPLVVLALALQGAPDVDASVNRTRLSVGEEVVLTIRVRSPGREPVRIDIPPPAGFALVGSRELTDVALADGARRVRTTVRELRLRAERPGRALLAGIRVRQGERVVAVNAIALDVAGGAGVVLSDAARALVERSALASDTVHVALLASADTVEAGEQLDLVALAWFPRELRLRLRRPPLLGLKTPDRVWAYPLLTSGDIALSRHVRGRWFDAFVAHQVVFPLQPGPLAVAPARVDFALPVSYSFFSREDRYALRSDSLLVVVRAHPSAGRPAGDRGVTARGLILERRVVSSDARVGEALDVEAVLVGTGNVALWPEPQVDWPPALRAYPGETTVELEPPGGPVQGRKTFRYLVVADSSGVIVLPELRYPYYDLAAKEYRVARAAAQALPVAPGTDARAARAFPPLAPQRGAALADRIARRFGGWGWGGVVVAPPLLVWLARRRRRRRPDPRSRGGVEDTAGLAALERQFQQALASHMPDTTLRAGGGLAHALRAAGIDSATAEHVSRVRDRLRAARYGPRGGASAPGLAEEIVKVLRVLDGEPARRRWRRTVAGALLMAAMLPAAAAVGQGAEALYDAGALRAAADSFAARAERAPGVAAHWYNLGATLYRAGADGKAAVAWTRAARLAPRDPLVRRARRLLPPPEAASEPLLVVGPATPAEYAGVALLAWIALWGAVLLRRRAVLLVGLAAVIVAVAAPGVVEWRRRAQPVAVVLGPGTAVRAAPYGGATTFLTLDAGSAVLLERRYGAWVRVRRADGVHGWVLGGEVAEL